MQKKIIVENADKKFELIFHQLNLAAISLLKKKDLHN